MPKHRRFPWVASGASKRREVAPELTVSGPQGEDGALEAIQQVAELINKVASRTKYAITSEAAATAPAGSPRVRVCIRGRPLTDAE
jgi:hypothetical protein